MAKRKNTDIGRFLENGKITQVPVPNRTKLPVLEYLAQKFAFNRTYTEKEVNAVIDQWHTFSDYFILRRLLIDYGFMDRTPNGAQYWRMNREEEKQ